MAKVLRINTKLGPKALGPYSTASLYQGVLYTSGQLGIDAASGELVSATCVEAQTKKTLENLEGFLKEVNLGMSDVLKCTVYLKVHSI